MKLMEALMMRRKWLRLERQRWALDGIKWGQAIRRSILVQVAGPDSGKDLGKYCQTNFGEVQTMSFYENTC